MSAPSLPLLLLTASLLPPQGYLLSIFLTLPVNTANAAGGLCGQKCSGLPPLPNAQCGTDACLPVFTQLSVFPPSTLSSLESTYIDGTKGTRTSYTQCCPTCDATTVCEPGEACGKPTDPPPPPPPAQTTTTTGGTGGSGGGGCDPSVECSCVAYANLRGSENLDQSDLETCEKDPAEMCYGWYAPRRPTPWRSTPPCSSCGRDGGTRPPTHPHTPARRTHAPPFPRAPPGTTARSATA